MVSWICNGNVRDKQTNQELNVGFCSFLIFLCSYIISEANIMGRLRWLSPYEEKSVFKHFLIVGRVIVLVDRSRKTGHEVPKKDLESKGVYKSYT